MTKRIKIFGAVAGLALAVAACGPTTSTSGGNAATARAATLFAVLTESVHDQNNPSLTAIDTVTPTNTPIPAATATLLATALPSVTPTSSQVPTPCYRAKFITDVTIPDGYDKLAPGETFVKTWKFQNTGSCDWAANTEIVYLSGWQLGGPSAQEIGQVVSVNATIEISVTLTAPIQSGTYTGYWMLRTPAGGRFGIGDAGDQDFWVEIVIKGNTATPTITNTAGTPTITNTPTVAPSPTQTPVPTSTKSLTPTITPTCAYPYC